MNSAKILPLLALSTVMLSGCGKKEEPKPAEPAKTAPAASTEPTTLDSAKQTAAEIGTAAKQAGEKIVEQGKDIAAKTGEQAKVAAAQIKEKATEATATAAAQVKEAAASLEEKAKAALAAKTSGAVAPSDIAPTDFAALSAKISESAKSLLTNESVTAPVKEQLTKLADSVLGNRDGAAAGALAKIVSLKPSEEQMGVVKEIQANLGVLALGRNFDQNDPASGGAVKQTIDAIRAKDTTAIATGLKNIGASAKLTDAQKEIVTNLTSSYSGKLSGVLDQVNGVSDKLKGFGL